MSAATVFDPIDPVALWRHRTGCIGKLVGARQLAPGGPVLSLPVLDRHLVLHPVPGGSFPLQNPPRRHRWRLSLGAPAHRSACGALWVKGRAGTPSVRPPAPTCPSCVDRGVFWRPPSDPAPEPLPLPPSPATSTRVRVSPVSPASFGQHGQRKAREFFHKPATVSSLKRSSAAPARHGDRPTGG